MPDFFTDLVEQAENLVLPEAQFPRRPITGSRVCYSLFATPHSPGRIGGKGRTGLKGIRGYYAVLYAHKTGVAETYPRSRPGPSVTTISDRWAPRTSMGRRPEG